MFEINYERTSIKCNHVVQCKLQNAKLPMAAERGLILTSELFHL